MKPTTINLLQNGKIVKKKLNKQLLFGLFSNFFVASSLITVDSI